MDDTVRHNKIHDFLYVLSLYTHICMCIYIYIYIYIYMYVCVYIYIYIYIRIHAYVYIYTYTYTLLCKSRAPQNQTFRFGMPSSLQGPGRWIRATGLSFGRLTVLGLA